MFRRKDNDPSRPADAAPEPMPSRPASEAKPAQPLTPQPPAQPELPRRQVEMPTSPSSTPFSASGERMQPASAPPASAPSQSAGKRLIVGQGISLSGEITACDRLVVEGDVQVTLNDTKAIEIAESGRFTNGKAEVDEAEISGVYEGDLTVRNRLMIRSTGQVRGNVRFGELEIERGGRLSGSISMLENTTSGLGGSRPTGSSGGSASSGGGLSSSSAGSSGGLSSSGGGLSSGTTGGSSPAS